MVMDLPSTSSSATAKRPRDQDPWEAEAPEAKHLKHDLLLDILDGDDDEEAAADPAAMAAADDLADVMRAFEEEIAASSVSPASSASSSAYEDYAGAPDVQQAQQLGFLLEASDDELGLPPPAGDDDELPQPQLQPFALPSGEDDGVSSDLGGDAAAAAANYWGFQDEDGLLSPPHFGGDEAGWQGAFGDDFGDMYLSWPSDPADFSSLVA